MSKVYYCYSHNLKNFLLQHGEQYIASGYHPTTQKKFWMFLRNENLDTLLGSWSKPATK